MKFTNVVHVLGFKRSRGVLENGTAYDSTKAYVVLPMDASKGDAVGQSCEPFNIGTSLEFDKWKGVKLPVQVSGEFEVVTSGNATKLVLHSITPLKA